MSKSKTPWVYIPFRCSDKMATTIAQIAAAESKSKSEVLRELVEKGLAAAGYISGEKALDKTVQEAVATALHPSVERLASISAKAANIGAAAFFMALYTDRLLMPESRHSELDEIAARARRLGIEYLKLSSGTDMDDWLDKANRRMTQE